MINTDDADRHRIETAEFEALRRYLTTVAHRMLGSSTDAEDAVQEAWLRLRQTDVVINDLRAWLTRVVSRICLDILRARSRRSEEPLGRVGDDDPVAATRPGDGPESRAEVTDAVGFALMIVLEQLSPDERLAYVLHDVFGLPFSEISEALQRSPQAARKLASRARAQVRGTDSAGAAGRRNPADRARQRAAVAAFLAAGLDGNFDQLLEILHPDVVLRVDRGTETGGIQLVRGATEVASRARSFRGTTVAREYRIVEIGDGFGALTYEGGVPVALLVVTSEGGLITHLYAPPWPVQ